VKKKTRLKPCPWCRKKVNVGPRWDTMNVGPRLDTMFVAVCETLFCGIGPSRMTRRGAALAWNKRVKP